MRSAGKQRRNQRGELRGVLRGELRDDRGSVLLLGIGFVIVCLLAVAVAVDVSAAFLQRRALMSIGDAAALAGAQAIDLDAYYENGATKGTRLVPRLVAGAARRHVAAVDSAGEAGESGEAGKSGKSGDVTIDSIVSDGVSVVVRLSAPLDLPFFGAVHQERVRIESSARLDYRPAP
jgi:hypothetical protein